MSTQDLLSTSPNGVRAFGVEIQTYEGELFDITGTIIEMSLYESIYFPYIHGELTLVDNSDMLSDFPFVGQERLRLKWERDEKITTREFLITKVANISRNRDGFGVYDLTVTSEMQMRNATSLFSRSYRGRGDEIIAGIYSDYLNTELNVASEAKTSHNVVFPYMKPLQAADMIRKNVIAEDNTPLFVYESLYPNEVRLESLGEMFSHEPIVELKSKKPSNTDPDAIASQGSLDERGTVYDMSITRAYNTYDQINKGAYGSYVTIADPSIREYQKVEFDFKKEAPTISGEWVTKDFTVGGIPVNEIYDTKNYYLHRNKYAFNTDFPNLSSIEDLDLSILNSYVHRHATSMLKVYIDSLAYIGKEPFGVGKAVEYTIPKFSPVLSPEDQQNDKVNSGKYIVASLRHYIQNGEYTMSAELIRDGIGEFANLDPLVEQNPRGRPIEPILPEF